MSYTYVYKLLSIIQSLCAMIEIPEPIFSTNICTEKSKKDYISCF